MPPVPRYGYGHHGQFDGGQTVKANRKEERQRILRIVSLLGGTLAVVVIVWLDVATGLWQDLVVLSGLAAGLVSFLLTSLVFKSIVARATTKRWAPVNRLAVTEFLHPVADDDRSEVAHGIIVPRTLPLPSLTLQGPALVAELRTFRERVTVERRELSGALSRWAEFLASTGENDEVLLLVARIAFQLDRVRDAALELEAEFGSTDEAEPGVGDESVPSHRRAELEAMLFEEITSCNTHFAGLVAELETRLAKDNALELEKRRRAASA